MTPTAVLFKLTFTTDAINTKPNNTLSTYTANSSAVNSVSFFRKYQDIVVGCDLTIRTIVPLDISTEPYRKVMVAILFFRRILSLSSSPSITISDPTATVAVYFAIQTSSAEREAERIVHSVCHDLYDVVYLQGIGFLDFSGRSIVDSSRSGHYILLLL